MPHIIPIRDLKNTSEVSSMCHNSSEPVFVTKNGYGDMVVMSIETYEKFVLMKDIYEKLDKAESDIKSKNTQDAESALNELKNKYEL